MDPTELLSVPVARRLDPIREYYFSGKLREIAEMNADGGGQVINLGIGSPDLPPHPSVVARLAAAAARPDAHQYQGYRGIPELRRAFARWYEQFWGVHLDPEGEVLPLIGSKEGIMHIAMTFLEAGTRALVPDPGYPTYRAASLLAGAGVTSYKLDEQKGWLPDLGALARQDLDDVRIMWLNYPNMPTGADADESFLADLIAFAVEQNILLVNDNPYGFILRERPLSLLRLPEARSVALELNSLSKSHNLAGWRVGVLAGRSDLLGEVIRFKSNMDSGMFRPVQLAAAEALSLGREWYDELNATYRARQRAVHRLLDALGCRYDPAAGGMFVWAKTPEPDGYAFSDHVLDRSRVFLTPGGVFGSQGEAFIRLSLCQPVKTIEEAFSRIDGAGLLKFRKPDK